MKTILSSITAFLISLTILSTAPLVAKEQDFSKLFGGKSDFLDVNDAFKLNTEIVDDEIIVRFDIADEYYLYRSRFEFNAKGASLGTAYIPGGKKKVDEYLGNVEVYYHTLEISVPFVAQKKEFSFLIEFQGCAEAGLCYPPEEKTVYLTADSVTTASGNKVNTAIATETSAIVSESTPNSATKKKAKFVPKQEELSNFLSDKSLLEIVFYMILLGIGLAFTPCVLPMVPILSSIIVGQGDKITTRRSFFLSLTYTQAMAIPFAGIGLLVGGASQLFGVDINTNTLQAPWFVIPAAVIFLLLSLSMFGFYELQLPAGMRNKLSNLSNDQQGGTLTGAAIMGALSALVVSPCVTVPVAGVLLYIAQTGDATIGGVALYSLAVGMGIPLLIVGVGGGKLLPKAGAWMNAVKAAFGVGMIAMALYITKHIIPETLNLILWSILLIVTATYMGAFSAVVSNNAKLWKGLGLFIFIYGLLLIVGAAIGNGELLKPLKGLTVAQVQTNGSNSGASGHPSSTDFERVKTIADVEKIVTEANAAGKTVMFDFFAVSCTACYEFEELVFPVPEVVAALSNSVLIQADVTANDAEDKALMKHFGVVGLPSILFFDKNGFEDKRLRAIGLEDAEVFVQRIEAAFTANL
ncbi:MAG: protein-disulfide reductase DsbD [Kangiellaceae bacterium]|nr:protein-disulfide reductase DsbD [Kangiellaceae bacterium]